MEERGRTEAADVVVLMSDMSLRSSDWPLLQPEDVHSSPAGVAVSLGVPERGESTKTGVRQGVRPDRPRAAEVLLRRKYMTAAGRKLFRISADQFRAAWDQTCRELSYDPGPPHNLRHTAAAYDLFVGYRTLDAIKVRGRWRAKTSVLRYGKTHVYLQADSEMPQMIRERGERCLAQWGERPKVPPA